MDLHWGQNITKRLKDPDSFLQPCVMFSLFSFFAEHLISLFHTWGTSRGDLHLKYATNEWVFLSPIQSITYKIITLHKEKKNNECNDMYPYIAVILSLWHSLWCCCIILIPQKVPIESLKISTHGTRQQSACLWIANINICIWFHSCAVTKWAALLLPNKNAQGLWSFHTLPAFIYEQVWECALWWTGILYNLPSAHACWWKAIYMILNRWISRQRLNDWKSYSGHFTQSIIMWSSYVTSWVWCNYRILNCSWVICAAAKKPLCVWKGEKVGCESQNIFCTKVSFFSPLAWITFAWNLFLWKSKRAFIWHAETVQ